MLSCNLKEDKVCRTEKGRLFHRQTERLLCSFSQMSNTDCDSRWRHVPKSSLDSPKRDNNMNRREIFVLVPRILLLNNNNYLPCAKAAIIQNSSTKKSDSKINRYLIDR